MDSYLVRAKELAIGRGTITKEVTVANTDTRAVLRRVSFNSQLRIFVYTRNKYGLSDSLEVFGQYSKFIIICLPYLE